jgi:DUF4097 and DUF4098 domain-containing protein YvlB
MTMRIAPTPILALAALVLAAAPLAAQHRNKSRSQSGDGSKIDTTVTVSRGATIDLSILSGDIKVTSWDKPQVRISAYSEEGDLRFEATSSRVSLTQEDEDSDGGDTKYEITVPKDARVIAGSVSGDVNVRGVAQLEGNSVSGSVTAVDVAGRTTIQSVSGDVQGTNVGGPVNAQDVSGDVTLSGVTGDLNVQTVSGELKLLDVKSSYVKTSTVSGDLQFQGALDPKGRYEFHSHSGSFTLVLPRGSGAQVSFRGFSGEMHSNCQMTLMPGSDAGRHNGMTFTIGAGGAKVNIETFSGDVDIQGCGTSKAKEN